MFVQTEDKELIVSCPYDHGLWQYFLHTIHASSVAGKEEYFVIRGSKSVFTGAAFLRFRGGKIAADGVSRQAHGFKSCVNKA